MMADRATWVAGHGRPATHDVVGSDARDGDGTGEVARGGRGTLRLLETEGEVR